MNNYGKLNNNQLKVITYVDHENGTRTIGINATTAKLFGLKEIVRGETPSYNHSEIYSETDMQIIVEYVEVLPIPEVWNEDTNFKIKMNSDKFISMASEVPTILPDLTNNVAEFGVTEIYLDEIPEDLLTLMKYFDENVIISERV